MPKLMLLSLFFYYLSRLNSEREESKKICNGYYSGRMFRYVADYRNINKYLETANIYIFNKDNDDKDFSNSSYIEDVKGMLKEVKNADIFLPLLNQEGISLCVVSDDFIAHGHKIVKDNCTIFVRTSMIFEKEHFLKYVHEKLKILYEDINVECKSNLRK